jgi:hypothetical protein
MEWIREVVSFLEGRGIGVYGETFFIGPGAKLPETDDPVTTFSKTGGVSMLTGSAVGTTASYIHNEPRKPTLTQPRMQAVTRASDPEVATRKAQEIYDALGSVTNDDIAGTRYLRVRPVQELFDMPPVSGRARTACNYEALRAPR